MTRHPPAAPPPRGKPANDTPAGTTVSEPRCWRCNRMLARQVTGPWHIDCPRCKAANTG